ncbi:hypothetical protein IT400_00820 [Candidatus Nomurabacteria bacterium]|nr:hypothetical protein [Candidatus Nomurabacteria bacterium]
MELPPIITPPPVPIPNRAISKEFHKSQAIVALAYIQVGLFLLSILSSVLVFFDDYYISRPSLIFIVPALIILFSKNDSTYKIARILLIIACFAFIGPLGRTLLFLFGNF